MGKAPVTQSVIELIEPGLLAKGIELVDVEIKKEKDFIRFSEKKICVQCHAPLNGRKKFNGTLKDFKNQSIHLEVDGELQTIPISRVAKANLVIEI